MHETKDKAQQIKAFEDQFETLKIYKHYSISPDHMSQENFTSMKCQRKT